MDLYLRPGVNPVVIQHCDERLASYEYRYFSGRQLAHWLKGNLDPEYLRGFRRGIAVDVPGESTRIDVGKCARCKKDHASLEFKRLIRVMEDSGAQWWALCPETGEPIIMKEG